jgi:hypothetical protein
MSTFARRAAQRVASRFLAREGGESLSEGLLQGLLGLCHALYWHHWTTHWQTKGDPYYGDHLLFERLYSGMVPEIDTVAEKLVQMHGSGAVAVELIHPVTGAWLSRWLPETDPVGRSLGAERDFQQALRSVYEDLKESGELSLGLDDFLMATANAHETNLYLLQQRMGGIHDRQASALDGDDRADMSAERHFFNKPRAREVREFAQSKAVSNDFGVAAQAVRSNEMAETSRQVRREVHEAPLTVPEILQLPGGSHFSTLNRYVVQTAVKTDPGVPQGHGEVPKHPDLLVR